MDQRMARVLAAGGGVASAGRLVDAGCTRSAIRWALQRGELHRLAPGLVTAASTWEAADARARHLLLLRASLVANPGTVAAGTSAAVVWGLPLPGRPGLPVVLRPRTAARPQYGQRSRTTVVRRAWLSADEHVVGPGGLRVTSPARTFVDCARAMTFPWAVAVADAARRSCGCTVPELAAAALAQEGVAGAARAARAAAVASNGAESPLESLARAVQIELGLPVPRTQVWIGEHRPEYRVDMLVEQFATVVEADGRVTYDGSTARSGSAWEEKRRTDRLLDLGYDCHRFVSGDLERPTAWGRALVRVFERSQRRRGQPPPRLQLAWI